MAPGRRANLNVAAPSAEIKGPVADSRKRIAWFICGLPKGMKLSGRIVLLAALST